MISAKEALQRLKDGNQRFAAGTRSIETMARQTQRGELACGQEPFAIILGCSDSRVPAELVFDQGLGDLFVIRIAGNIVAPSQIGSVEFAVDHFNTNLVVVLGHSCCGAVSATLEELKNPTNQASSNILSIVNRIRPTVKPLYDAEPDCDPEVLLNQAIRANILAATNNLRHGSSMLEQYIQAGKLCIIGAEYSLETGVVDFFDDI